MARYIDADKVIQKKETVGICDPQGNFYGAAEVIFVSDIVDIPTAAVEEVRHGEWIEEQAQHVVYRLKNRAFWVKYTCPFCGKKNGRYKANYCPNCGAAMRGGKE